MIPILWRYLATSFMRVFSLSMASFISVLVVMRLEEIARFASAGTSWNTVLLFTLYQIPYILPIAIPISSLIAALILFYRMSDSQELTSLRSAGISLGHLMAPLIFLSILLAVANFLISSEFAPYVRAKSKKLVFEAVTKNPLILLQKDAMLQFKQAYFDMRSSPSPGKASEVLFIAKNASNGRLGLMLAKELDVNNGDLCGKQVSFISSLDPKYPNAFDHLIIENQTEMTTATAGLSQVWEDAQWQLHDDYLPLRFLLAKESVEHGSLLRRFGKPHVEFAKRYSLSLATITFTFIGLCFGIKIGRIPRRKTLIWAISLAAAFLITFIAAKSLKSLPKTAFFLYLIPHPCIALICLLHFRRRAKGLGA